MRRSLKKDPFFREIRNAGAAPLCTWVPPPPPPRVPELVTQVIKLEWPYLFMQQSIESGGGMAGWGRPGLSSSKYCPSASLDKEKILSPRGENINDLPWRTRLIDGDSE